MTLPLTQDTLKAAYDYLATTPPFLKWNLPDSDDVRFVISGSRDVYAWYRRNGGKHEIGVSTRYIGRTQSLIAVMAHELVHLHQRSSGMETPSQHNAAFHRLAAQVCEIHGFDPQLF